MCTENTLHKVTDTVLHEAKNQLGELLDSVILYGSYARGDYDEESDIDILVRINCTAEELRKYYCTFVPLASRLSVEFGVTVSVTVCDMQSFSKYRTVLPFYKNIESEGITVA